MLPRLAAGRRRLAVHRRPRAPALPAGAAALAAQGTSVLGLVGAEDHLVPPADWARIDARLTDAGVPRSLVSYPATPHGFLCPDRPSTHRAPKPPTPGPASSPP
ncbi:dienelactone hydrolase family protein [Kitasatospora cheerisanensis]|uniref:dienelactone hydrolase family protein n=1 Tax=Kitasatospora cheerisanensis TaxID=81942 RepID=UPI003CC6C8DB